VWRIGDGEPLAGQTVLSEADPDCSDSATPRGGDTPLVYPTGGGIDLVMRAIHDHAAELASLIGHKGEAWNRFSARAYVYPAGTGLSWHHDSDRYSGAFVYYAHPQWSSQWGGELLVADESCRGLDTRLRVAEWDTHDPTSVQLKRLPPQLLDEPESAALSAVGVGQYIVAKPNRLVILAAGQLHKINAVHPAAGDRVRCSISGFFLRPTR
jgi:hypothetical protein